MDNNQLEKLKALRSTVQAEPMLKTQPSASSGHSNGDYQKHKDAQIAKSVALNNAATITAAYAHIIAATDMVKTMKESEIRGWLKSLKITELIENLKFLTGKESDEIPF